jgi:hypothetical protein
VTRVKWKLVSFFLEIVLNLTQDRCMVCADGAIGLQSFCAHPMGLVGDVGKVEACFYPIGDSFTHDARLVHGVH